MQTDFGAQTATLQVDPGQFNAEQALQTIQEQFPKARLLEDES